MFGNNAELERQVRDLSERHYKLVDRVIQLENEIAPFRIGELPYSSYFSFYPLAPDARPKVTLRQAIDILREHLKLRWNHVKTIPERIELERIK